MYDSRGIKWFKAHPMRAFGFLILFFLFAPLAAIGQTSFLADDQAREVAGAAIRPVYPEPCYSTYRDERLESFLYFVRVTPLEGDQINNSVYFYRVASDVCNYITIENGKPVVHTQTSMDCCNYGIVAVGRATSKSYWFSQPGKKAADVFKQFIRDENLRPDSSRPTLFGALYRELVWGGNNNNDNEITSLQQLRELVQSNFQSAYSPYERDNTWQRKFDTWWHGFQSRMGSLKLETTYETTARGTIVRGYAFTGFELSTPRSDPPPKGMPQLFQWAFLVASDGTVEEEPSKIIYSRR
jgi:hypothetical protein